MESTTIDKSFVIQQIRKLFEKEDVFRSLDKPVDFSVQSEISTLEESKIQAATVLWDLSINPEFALFLFQNHIIDVLYVVLSTRFHSSRLYELSMGTLANLVAAQKSIAEQVSKNINFVNLILYSMLPTEDVYILAEVLRFLSVMTATLNVHQFWLQKIRETKFGEMNMMDFLLFILENSLNDVVLERVSNLLWNIIYFDTILGKYLIERGCKVLVNALKESVEKEREAQMIHLLNIFEVASVRCTNEEMEIKPFVEVANMILKNDEYPSEVYDTTWIIIANLMQMDKEFDWVQHIKDTSLKSLLDYKPKDEFTNKAVNLIIETLIQKRKNERCEILDLLSKKFQKIQV